MEILQEPWRPAFHCKVTQGVLLRPDVQSHVYTVFHKQETQLMLTNSRDAFTPGMVSY